MTDEIKSEQESQKKQIMITGTNNRYQMKKVTQKKALPKKRVLVESWNLEPEFYTYEKQIELLEQIKQNDYATLSNFPLLNKEIERKIQGYRQQDVDKKVLDSEKIVKLLNVIQMLIESQLNCYYCKTQIFVLYEMSRENSQWTLDRIDNDLGHNIDNILICCLKCNLKRRRTNKDKFLMTKQLNIVRDGLRDGLL